MLIQYPDQILLHMGSYFMFLSIYQQFWKNPVYKPQLHHQIYFFNLVTQKSKYNNKKEKHLVSLYLWRKHYVSITNPAFNTPQYGVCQIHTIGFVSNEGEKKKKKNYANKYDL